MGDSLATPVPYDDLPHRRTFLLLAGALLVLLLVTVAAGWYAHTSATASFALLQQTRDTDQALEDLLSGLTDAETGQRGYLLTGKPAYLEPYRAAVARLPAVRERVRSLAPGPAAADLLAQLDALVDAKLGELEDTVRFEEAGRHDQALALVQTGAGQTTMSHLRRLVAGVRGQEAAEVARRQADVAHWLGFTRAVVAACFALFVAALGMMVSLWRRAERTRRSHAEHLLTANTRLRAVVTDRDRLVSVVAHDLRSVFTPALGYADLLRTEAEADGRPALANHARQVVAAVTRASDLLANLVDWARRSVGAIPLTPAVVPVRDAVDQVIQLYADLAADKRVALANEVGPAVTAFVDPPILQAVLRNLVSNAVKYSRAGGRVEVGGRANGAAVLTVRDSGVGMPADVKARVLGRGRVHPTPGTKGERGTGLGLAICVDYLARSGGAVEVDTAPGQGTTFTVTLPSHPPVG